MKSKFFTKFTRNPFLNFTQNTKGKIARKLTNCLSAGLCGILALSLSSCGENVPTVAPYVSSSTPALTEEQVAAIRASISTTLKAAEAANDPNTLESRLEGPELILRKAQMRVKIKSGEMDSNAKIPDTKKQMIVSNSLQWPRVSFIITDVTEDRQTERLLVLVQDDARANYKLWGITRLFPDKQLPNFDVAETKGSAIVSPIDSNLKITPEAALSQYSDLLQNGDNSKFVADFTADDFRTGIKQGMDEAATQLEKVQGSQSQNFTAKKGDIYTLRSADGGALLVGEIDSEWTRSTGNGSHATPSSQAEKDLTDDTDYSESITVTYMNMVAIYIPPKDSKDKIQILGAERAPISLRKN